ncbi:MAG TPA: hypothetical protein VII28_02930 [Puia sp.]
MRKYLFLFFFLFSCGSPRFYVIRIPHDYEGYIFLIYGADTNNSKKLGKKGEYLFVDIDSPPIQFISNKFDEKFNDLRLVVYDLKNDSLLNPKYDNIIGGRMFGNAMNEISVNGKSYKYFSAFFTKKNYKAGSSQLDSIMNLLKFQLDIFRSKIVSLTLSEK